MIWKMSIEGYNLRIRNSHPPVYFGSNGNMTMEKTEAINFLSLEIIALYDIPNNILNRFEIVPVYKFSPLTKKDDVL